MDTESVIDNPDIPQWKKDLIARLRSQNHLHHHHHHHNHHLHFLRQQSQSSHQRPRHQQQQHHSSGQRIGDAIARSDDAVKESPQVEDDDSEMVQEMVHERPWNGRVLEDNGSGSGSDSSEDLHYGPGIVKKLKNKYLSLALRESNARPSILHLRKATSLENLLDEDAPAKNNNEDMKKSQNRYHRKQARGEMKRARSVETISRIDNNTTTNNNRQSLHEDVLIAEVETNKKTQDKPLTQHFNHHRSRPKRLQPVMCEKEKPPADFVKQAKMIFERRPEQRTRKPPLTGKVAAKVDSFNNIIGKAKVDAKKKPPIKSAKPKLTFAKPVLAPREDSLRHLDLKPPKKELTSSLPSPIPDVSRVDGKCDNDSTLSETPDLILTFSSPVHKKATNAITCESFLKEEIRNTSPVLLESPSKKITSPLLSPNRIKPASPLLSPTYYRPASPKLPLASPKKDKTSHPETQAGYKPISPTSILNISNQSTSAIFNFTDRKPKALLNENVSESIVPVSEPLEIGVGVAPPSPPKGLTTTEIEKNLINSTLSEPKSSAVVCVNVSVEVVNSNVLPKKLKAREQSSNIAVFNFTSRKDVPDYISNDRSRSTSRPELPKPGEGGIIVLSPTSLEAFIDEDDEILRSLERPPSPCDVTFINDNILIDGKSSLNQKTKRTKLKLTFVEEGPEVYEYPSESSLLLEEDTLILSSQVGHTVPNLGGSYLANYTPKTTESFQPGVTRTAQSNVPIKQDNNGDMEVSSDLFLEEADKPFSLGGNADILF